MIYFFKTFPDISHISQNGLKKSFYNNKIPTYAKLMEILKANEIKGYSHYTKLKLNDLLIKRGLISEKHGNNKPVKAKKDMNPNYNFLKRIRGNSKMVEINDLKTDKVIFYPSTYKATLTLDQSSGVSGTYNGKVWRNRYAI